MRCFVVALALLFAAAPAAATPRDPPPATANPPRPAPPAARLFADPPRMPAGYATIFMGPPQANFPRPPPAPQPRAAVAAAPAAPNGGVHPSELCRAAIATAEREHALPPHLLAAIARVESGRRDPATGVFGPWPWTINAEGRGNFFPDRAAALAGVRQQQAQGVRSIDVGCMQVNLRHHPNAFASLEAAFDPLTNARYAARFLRDLATELGGDWNRAASAYHSRTPEFATPYLAKVNAAWAAEKSQPNGGSPAAFAALARPAPSLPLGGGGAFLSNGGDRAALVGAPAGASGAGRGLDAYRAVPIAIVGRQPVVYNGPHRRL